MSNVIKGIKIDKIKMFYIVLSFLAVPGMQKDGHCFLLPVIALTSRMQCAHLYTRIQT